MNFVMPFPPSHLMSSSMFCEAQSNFMLSTTTQQKASIDMAERLFKTNNVHYDEFTRNLSLCSTEELKLILIN